MKKQNPSQKEVLNSIEKGIRNAMGDYKKAAGIPLCHGPEYLITVYIFQSILGITKRDSLTLEVKPEVMLEYLGEGRRPGRKPKSARIGGRGDIYLWHVGTNRPRAIIEVKKDARQSPKDLKRVTHLVLSGFEFAVLASCMQKEVKNDNENEVKKDICDNRKCLYEEIKKQINSNGSLDVELVEYEIETLTFEGEKPEENEDWVWCPVCFKIYKP